MIDLAVTEIGARMRSIASTACDSLGGDEAFEFEPMADYPTFHFSVGEARRAGNLIGQNPVWTSQTEGAIRHAFAVANNWREAHAFPMHSVRGRLRYLIARVAPGGFTAARLKRMQAIRSKLMRQELNVALPELQDIAGCRVVVGSVAEARALAELYIERAGDRGEEPREKDYIAAPKPDGYRCHHIIVKYRGEGERAAHNGRRVEAQIRTRAQHAWATAVESVGMYRGEYLKGSKGDADWLSLFKLMSDEIADAEGCPVRSGAPARTERIKEIRTLNSSLDAVGTLENLRHVIRWTAESVSPRSLPTHFLIRYDRRARSVGVEAIYATAKAVQMYREAEAEYNQSGEYGEDIVLVEVDKIESLKRAYPNYFLDVEHFTNLLRDVVHGRAMEDYRLIPQPRARAPVREAAISVDWMRGSRMPRPKGG